MTPADRRHQYWRRTLQLTAILLAAWLVVTLAAGLWGRDLDFDLMGWPFGYWLASQGALILFVAIVWAYAIGMNRIDREFADTGDD